MFETFPQLKSLRAKFQLQLYALSIQGAGPYKTYLFIVVVYCYGPTYCARNSAAGISTGLYRVCGLRSRSGSASEHSC